MLGNLIAEIPVNPTAPPGVAEKISEILGYVAWTGAAVCVAAILIGGITILLSATGRGGDGAERVVRVTGLVLVGAAMISGATALGSALVPGV